MKRKLCEPISGREAATKVLTEAEVVAKGYPKRDGILGYVDGIISVCDKENKNHRVYEKALWEEVHRSERFRSMLSDMTLLGEPDHPETRTQSSIKEGSHTLVDQYIDDDGKVRGTVMVFDNPLGQIVWPMLKAGVKLGFSTRGDGDLVEDSNGRTKVDPKSYEYHGVDFVINPSFVEARPEAITEDVVTKVRMALTEATKRHQADDSTRHNIGKLLESVGARTAPASGSMKSIETLVRQLSEAHERIAELEENANRKALHESEEQGRNTSETERIQEELETTRDTLAAVRSKKEMLENQLARTRGTLRQLNEKVKGTVDAAELIRLKRVMKESQDSHLGLVNRHQQLLEDHGKLEAKYQKSVEVVGELRAMLNTARGQAEESKHLAEQAEARTKKAIKELEAHRRSIPNIITDSTLVQYKKLRTEDTDVPEEFAGLLERAATQEEVDAVLEAISTRQSERYSFLPMGSRSRGIREALAEQIPAEGATGGSATTEERDADTEAEQIREVTRRQLRR